MSPSKKILTAALAALSLSACTESSPPPKPLAVIPSKTVRIEPPITSEVRDAGAPFTVAPKDETPVDPLVVAHDSKDVDHLGRAKSLVGEGDVKGGLLEARRALFTTPNDVETLTLVAKLSRRTGQQELAAEAWGRVAGLTPEDATPLIQQARAMITLKDYSGAVIAGREAIARDSGNAEAFQVTGLAQLAMNELSGAISSFEKTIELAPNHGWAHNNLGFACLRANRNEEAVAALEKAAELLPTVAYVHNNLGVALERVGRTDEAKAAYQQAMDLSPKYVKARINADRVARAPRSVEPDDSQETMSDVPHAMPEQPEQ
ncbi:MAG: tetratricopeptide repeat protein [Myxococcota bacterium]